MNNKDSQQTTLKAKEVWERLHGKPLTSKKSILEYIDILGQFKRNNLTEKELGEGYNYIYEHIEAMKGSVKANTLLFLKNKLKSTLGKYAKDKDPKPVDHFIIFFSKAYPPKDRRKDYTRVLMDKTTVSDEQLWTTLTYINRQCIKTDMDLTEKQIDDIVEVIESSVKRGNGKLINNIRSLRRLMELLDIKIVNADKGYKVEKISL